MERKTRVRRRVCRRRARDEDHLVPGGHELLRQDQRDRFQAAHGWEKRVRGEEDSHGLGRARRDTLRARERNGVGDLHAMTRCISRGETPGRFVPKRTVGAVS